MTVLTAPFTQPQVGQTVVAKVKSTTEFALGLPVFTPFGGYYRCGKITSQTSVTLTNLGWTGNTFPGSVIGTGQRLVAAGEPGPLLSMRWTWIAGAVDPKTMGGGIGCDNEKFNRAGRLFIRGGSNDGGPNPVNLWKPFFANGGHLELSVPNTPKWIVYRVEGYETLEDPQVQAFTVHWLDSQEVFQAGDEVHLSYAMGGGL